MKIGIIGGGAIGLLFSYYLSEHQSICLYVHSSNNMIYFKRKELIFEKDGQRKKISVQVKLSPNGVV